METTIEVKKLCKSYNGVKAIENVNISVCRGEVFGLLGANGAGKSTTIECILGTKKQDSGIVSILGMNPQKDRKKLFEKVGVQFQEANYQDKIKVAELCELTASLYKTTSNYGNLLKQFGLSDKLKSFVSELSGGQKQRLFIVLALIPNPEVVFLDELTTGLDAKARRDVWKSISDLKKKGLTILLTSHFMDEVEQLCDKIMILKNGKSIFYGTVQEAVAASLYEKFEDSYLGIQMRRKKEMKAFKTLFKIESKLSLRGIDMFIFAICMPVVIVFILGIVFGNKPAFEGAGYTFLEQSFGAVSAIAICAGGLMGLPLVVSDYRTKKILRRFQVTPTSPAIILSVQVVIYALYSIVSLILVYVVGAVFFNYQLHGSWLHFLGAYLLVMISMFSIGLLAGGIASNAKTAGVIASLLYFPMLIFSGSTLPYEVMPSILQKIADILPLTQGIKLLKAASLGLPIANVLIPVIVMIVIAVTCISISLKFFKWE